MSSPIGTEVIDETTMLDRFHYWVNGFRTRKEAAAELNISQQYLSDIYKGHRALPVECARKIGYERAVIYVRVSDAVEEDH